MKRIRKGCSAIRKLSRPLLHRSLPIRSPLAAEKKMDLHPERGSYKQDLVCQWIEGDCEDKAGLVTSTSSDCVPADSAIWFSSFSIALRTSSAALFM